jgi:hypothetical protein
MLFYIVLIVLVGVAIILLPYLNKNKAVIEKIVEEVNHATKIVDSIIPLIPNEKLQKNAVKIADIAKLAAAEVDKATHVTTVEEKQALATESVAKALAAIGHSQSEDQAAITKAVTKIVK